MPEGPDGKTIIIVKKSAGHGGHHGGAWKVAYADFVTSMMALFMVLWLVNSASSQTRERIASYFKKPGIFEKGSGTPLQEGGAGILPDVFAPPQEAISRISPTLKIYTIPQSVRKPIREGFGEGKGESLGDAGPAEKEGEALEKIAEEIKAVIEEEELLSGPTEGYESKEVPQTAEEKAKEQAAGKSESAKTLGKVEVIIDQRGLHIEIMDTPNASMFPVGTASLKPEAQETLMKIGRILTKLPNPIDIEGHTDARPFSPNVSAAYDNWNLSVDRANAARRALQDAGLQAWQVARVVGYADGRPKVPADKFNDSNRRISISMLYTEEAALALVGAAQEFNPADERTKGTFEGAVKQKEEVKENIKKIDEGSKLTVDVETTLPEGRVTTEVDDNDKKDKIFDSKNPFFGR